MTAYKSLYIIVHLVVFLGFLSLKLAGNIGLLLFGFSLFATFISFYNVHSGKHISFSNEYTSSLGVAVISYLAASYFLLDVESYQVLVHFLVLVQIIKLLGQKNISDYRQLIILSFFQFLSVSVTTTGIAFGVITFVFLTLSTTGIILHNICYDAEKYTDIDEDRVVRASFLKITIPAVLLILLFTSVIFVSMPRFRRSLVTASFVKSNSLKSGYSDEVNLGRVGEIKRDNTQVMSVKFLNNNNGEGPIRNLYWRGVTLNHFDGKTWRMSKERKRIHYEDSSGIVFLGDKYKKDLVKQEIIIEPMDTNVLFAADTPVAYQNLPYSRLKEVNDSHYTYSRYPSKIKYIAYSYLERKKREEKSTDTSVYPVSIRRNYLDDVYETERIDLLADELYEPSSNEWTNVMNVKNYLEKNYQYTRTLDISGENFPVDEFLFNNKKGHCEYFATSMVVLLQNMGIPARLVTGFLQGDYNEQGDFYIIRESHAHAWVEVFFNDSGWVRFDPSPVGDGTNSDSSFFTAHLELLKYRWNRYIVDYDADDQRNLMSSIRNSIEKTEYDLFAPGKVSNDTYLSSLAILFLIVAAVFGYRFRDRFLPSYVSSRKNRVSAIYRKGLQILDKQGISKQPHTTSSEFSEIVERHNISDPDFFNEFTLLYEEARFGYRRDDELVDRMEEIVKQGKKTWKQREN